MRRLPSVNTFACVKAFPCGTSSNSGGLVHLASGGSRILVTLMCQANIEFKTSAIIAKVGRNCSVHVDSVDGKVKPAVSARENHTSN